MEVYFDLIRAERQHQIERWGREFDTLNTANDWIAYITHYASRCYGMDITPEKFRESMVKTATLCIAAIENLDGQGLYPRHFDKEPIRG